MKIKSKISNLTKPRIIIGSWLGLFLTSFVIIPTQFSQNYFDSLAFPHFAFLVFTSTVFAFAIFRRDGFKNIGSLEGLAIIALVVCYAISIGLSGNSISTLTGDTQRFTGAISLFAFLVILIYHANIRISDVKRFTISITSIVTGVSILGALQQWKVISLPGAGGAGSTLGNIDFLSAWIGTTIPLFLYLLTRNNLRKTLFVILELAFSIYLLVVLNVKQGWVDLLLAALFGCIYLFRARIRALNLSRKALYWAFGLVGFLWVELVLLVPFQKSKVPLIGTDPNVQIRTQYWLAGLKTFFHSFFFGVGPDNYGNYYQQFRTLTSVLREETTVSNDAHSALFQTLSTLGIFGSFAFLIIFALLVRAISINYHRYPNHRKFFYFVSVFFVIYSTNAMISPITLPHKFIFWSYVGLMFGLAFKSSKLETYSLSNNVLLEEGSEVEQNTFEVIKNYNSARILKPITAFIAIISLVVTILISIAQYNLIRTINDLQVNSKSQRVMNYEHTSFFPCTYYYLTEQTIANQNSIDKVIKFAEAEVKTNPRCVDARLTLAKYYFAKGDSAHLGWEIKALMEMAPANREVLGLVGEMATKLGDRNLLGALHNQEVKLGFIK